MGGSRVAEPGRRRVRGIDFIVLVAAVIAVLAAVSCTSENEEAAPTTTVTTLLGRGGVLRLAAVGAVNADPAYMNPADQSSLMLSDLLFDGLTSIDPTSDAVVPALAVSWEHDETAARWTFKLRPDARFSDGSTVTAADFKASFERLARQGSSSLAGVRLEMIAGYAELANDPAATVLSGIEVLDDQTLVFNLVQPFAEFDRIVSIPELGVLPSETPGQDEAGEPRIPAVTSGPFKVVDRSETLVKLEPSEGSKALLDAVEISFFENSTEAYEAFGGGEVDWSPVPTAAREDAKKDVDGYSEPPMDIELWFGINLAKAPLDNERMREALIKAVDRHGIVDDVLPGRLGLNGTVVKGIPGAVEDACGETCKYDPAGARAILAELYPDGAVPTIEISHYDDEVQKAIVDALVADLTEVGIPTSIKNLSFPEYREFVASGQATLFSYGWVGIAPVADAYIGPLFLSESHDNVFGFVDPGFDQTIRDARATIDPAERQKRYQAIETDAMSRVPLLPISQFTAPQVLDEEHVKEWTTRLDGTFDTESVWVISD